MASSFRRLSSRLVGAAPSAPLRRQALTRGMFPVSTSLYGSENTGIGERRSLKLGSNFYLGMRTTASNNAASNLNMPALSPTMTEGTISSWKVKEGLSHLPTIKDEKKAEDKEKTIWKWEGNQ